MFTNIRYKCFWKEKRKLFDDSTSDKKISDSDDGEFDINDDSFVICGYIDNNMIDEVEKNNNDSRCGV